MVVLPFVSSHLFLVLILCIASVVAMADSTQQQERVQVTATRSALPLERFGSAIVITNKDIELHQYRYLSSLLRSLPGLYVARSGGRGGQASLFTRGSESNHTVVYIDGIKVTDPALGGVFALDNFQLHGVERIEILRGAYSAQLGSEAIGGVINIITNQGRKTEASAEIEYGTHNTRRLATQWSQHNEHWNASLAISAFASDGQSHTAPSLSQGNNEDDAYRNVDYKFTVGIDLKPDWDLLVYYGRSDSETEYDGGFVPPFEDLAEQDKTEQRVSAKLKHQTEYWQSYLQLSQLTFDTKQSDGSFTDGARDQLTWHSDWAIQPYLNLSYGLEYEGEEIKTATINKQIHNHAIYVGGWFTAWENIALGVNLRYDYPEDTNASSNGQISASWSPSKDLLFHANYGTAFKTPTLSERFGFGGNPKLKAEDSRAWEFGVRKQTQDPLTVWASLQWSVNYFNNNIRDLIAYNFVTQQLENIRQADIEGVELAASLQATPDFLIGGNLTLLSAEDKNNQRLVRRPVRQAHAYGVWNYTKDGSLALRANYVGPRRDIDRTTFASVNHGGYAIYNATWNHKLSPSLTGSIRVDNFFDKRFEPVDGYQGERFGVFASLRYQFE